MLLFVGLFFYTTYGKGLIVSFIFNMSCGDRKLGAASGETY
jgi:hypothetical protein